MAREKIAVPLLNGESARRVAHRLNVEGIRARNGKMWTATTVAKLAHSPLWAGLLPDRERIMDERGNPTGRWKHHGRPYMDDKGQTVSVGPGDIAKGERVIIEAKLASRTRPEGRGKRPPEYVLTDTLRCGRCNGPRRTVACWAVAAGTTAECGPDRARRHVWVSSRCGCAWTKP
ncbi:recombinase family protein [Streptomyces rimosus]|uniref:recombinase family protein n=1 Tax=Streptomyces rimosus TaxID=1927 RepID=UPI00131D3191